MPGVRVLLVDDDGARARSLATTLKRAGYDARTTKPGAVAIKAAARSRPAVIVLDIAAFGATGTQLHAELLRHDPDVRVVLTTGLPPTSLICAALAPTVPLLYHPVRGEALIDALEGSLAAAPLPGLGEVLEAYVASLRNLTSSPDLEALRSRLADCAQAREELLPKLKPTDEQKRGRD